MASVATATRWVLGVALISLLGAYLRLADLGGPSLWLDEILHLRVVQSLGEQPWYRYLLGVREINGGTENGILYYALQGLGQRLMPGDAGTRIFPALIGTLTVPLMAVTGRRLGGPLLGLVAAFSLAVSPLHVYFSREGRPYALLMALSLALLLLRLAERSRPSIAFGYLVCLTATYVGVHAVPILVSFAALAALDLGWHVWRRRPLRRSLALHQLTAAVLALGLAWVLYLSRSEINTPNREVSHVQAETEQSAGFQPPISRRSLTLFLASMTTSGHPTVSMVGRSWVLIAVALVGLAFLAIRRQRQALASVGMFVLPAVLSVAALASVGRWYGIRYTSTALPAFLLLTAAGLVAGADVAGRAWRSRRAVVRWTVAGVASLALVAPNFAAARTDPYRKLDWRGIARFIDRIATEDEAVLVANAWPEVCLGHYLRVLGREVELVNLWERVDLAEAEVARRGRGWLLTAGFRRSDHLRAWMHRFVPVLKALEEEMDLFFFPDFETLFETRLAANKGAHFEQRFAAMGGRFEFVASDSALQGRGWSGSETMPDGTTFQWAEGERATLGLPIAPRDVRLRLRVLPFVYPDAPPQRITLELGGEPIGVLELPARWSEHEVAVPVGAWHRGGNLLTLRFSHSARPADVIDGAGDTRPLSVAFDYLEVVP